MKQIEVIKWDIKMPEKPNSPKGKIIKKEETLLDALKVVMDLGLSNENLKGFDNMRKISRITMSFNKADKEGLLILDDEDYELLKGFVEKYPPAIWGANKDIFNAIEKFKELK